MKKAEKSRKRLQPDQRRSQLVECAIKATAENGIARVTHSHVAAISGVSIPTVHAYFRTRSDLVDIVLKEVDEHLTTITDACFLSGTSVYERLFRLALRFGQDARDRADLILVWLDWSTGVRSPVWDRYLFRLDKLHRSVEAVLHEDLGKTLSAQDISIRAKLYVGGGHTLALMQFAGATDEEITQTSEDLARQALLKGRRKR